MALIDDVKAALMVGDTDDPGIVGEIQSADRGGQGRAENGRRKSCGKRANGRRRRSLLSARSKPRSCFYCRAHFGMDNPDADRYEQRFEKLKQILSVDDLTKDPASSWLGRLGWLP